VVKIKISSKSIQKKYYISPKKPLLVVLFFKRIFFCKNIFILLFHPVEARQDWSAIYSLLHHQPKEEGEISFGAKNEELHKQNNEIINSFTQGKEKKCFAFSLFFTV